MEKENISESDIKLEILKYQKVNQRNNIIMVVLLAVFILLCIFAIYMRFFG